MPRDVRDLAWSGESDDALGLFDAAVDATASFHGDPLGLCRKALEIDPGLHAARLLQGHVLALSLNAPFRAAAARAIAPLDDPAVALSERERLHKAAIEAWLAGEPMRASGILAGIVERWPRDLMALFFSHQADFFAANNDAMLPRLDRALEGWNDGLAGHSWLLGMRAFALEEAGRYAEAEDLAIGAVERQPLDAWAIHARGHVLEMQGRTEEGIAWYRSTEEQWSKDCFFAVHNWWHRALYHLDREEFDDALALYDRGIAPDERSISLNLCDAAALLWRLWLRGVDTGGRWPVVAERFEAHSEAPCHIFNDVHAGLSFAACGQWERFDAHRARLAGTAGMASGHAAMLRDLGLPAIDAAGALARGRAVDAADLLEAAMPHEALMTGSHAQRDILPLTLIEAELRAGRGLSARRRLERRAGARPASAWIARDLARC
ncbi:MAG: tetratricopeptide repeat protein [Geminicoccaceae bacterium]